MSPDRYKACLLGGALGDAMGAPVEFIKCKEILALYGEQGVTAMIPSYGRAGAITDDTQMMLFTAEGLLRGQTLMMRTGVVNYAGCVGFAYMRWLKTQDVDSEYPMPEYDGWLFKQKELHHRRAPGKTCLSALRFKTDPANAEHNNSKGCGGVMRVAPVSLFINTQFGHETPPGQAMAMAFELARECAKLTHGHPSGYLAAGAYASILIGILRDIPIQLAVEETCRILKDHSGYYETHEKLQQALRLARAQLSTYMAQPLDIIELGQGWVAEEALAVAVYCAIVAPDFRRGVQFAINHDGDSDSTGLLTGHLLGAMLGMDALPPEWLEVLELKTVIEEIASDLYHFGQWKLQDKGLLEKYPCW